MHNTVMFFAVLALSFGTLEASEHTVEAPAGDINGYEYFSELYPGQKGVQFLGIPYAEPPLENLRFSKPVRLGRFSEAYNASEYGNSCIQNRDLLGPTYSPLLEPDEDCLSLNVFVPPDALNGNKKATMVFIHGGSFILGGSKISGGEHLPMFGDVIVVTVNYRVGPFGFMDMGVDEAPANVGLWDQHMALKWVGDNIESFGGQKDNVTLFGESAGGASVTYQMMYEGNEGLFQRAIAQSGSLAAPWASTTRNESKKLARDIAISLGCDLYSSKSRLDCMRGLDPMTIHNSAMAIKLLGYAPLKDDDFVKFEPKFCRDSKSACADEMINADFLSGVNDFDGIVFVNAFYRSWKSGITEETYMTYLLPLIVNGFGFKGDKQVYTELIKNRYSDHRNASDIARMYKVLDLFSDSYFVDPASKISGISYNSGNTNYKYRYRHKSVFSQSGPLIQGANHAEDLAYVMGFQTKLAKTSGFPLSAIPADERDYSKVVMTYWTNFAKSGDPNYPSTTILPALWPEYDNETKEFLDFGAEISDILPDSRMYADRLAFWMDLLPAIEKNMLEKTETVCPVSNAQSIMPSIRGVISIGLTVLCVVHVYS